MKFFFLFFLILLLFTSCTNEGFFFHKTISEDNSTNSFNKTDNGVNIFGNEPLENLPSLPE